MRRMRSFSRMRAYRCGMSPIVTWQRIGSMRFYGDGDHPRPAWAASAASSEAAEELELICSSLFDELDQVTSSWRKWKSSQPSGDDEVHDSSKQAGSVLALCSSFEKNLRLHQELALSVPLANPRDVFTNGELRLDELQVLGFDYDYTLAHYNEHIEFLIYDMAMDLFLQSSGYPEELKQLRYDPRFAIRGLHFDKQKGLLLKLDSLNHIQEDTVHYGRRMMSAEEVEAAYPAGFMPKTYMQENMQPLDDVFCLPEACLLADVIHYMNQKDIDIDPSYVFEDVKTAVEHVHDSGALHDKVMQNPGHYVAHRPELVDFLLRMQESGKKLFMATNSSFPFVHAGMQQIIPPKDLAARGMSEWTDLFDAVLVNVKKPRFFRSKRPFRLYDRALGKIMWTKVHQLRKGEVYEHGSLQTLVKLTGWQGKNVLYFGDHVFNDMREPHERAGWRTGALVYELEDEVDVQNSPAFRRALVTLAEVEGAMVACMKNSTDLSAKVRRTLGHSRNRFRTRIRQLLKGAFNPHFGSVFRTHKNASHFAIQIQSGASVYTSHLENFLQYPPHFSFYPTRIALPHEPNIPGSRCSYGALSK